MGKPLFDKNAKQSLLFIVVAFIGALMIATSTVIGAFVGLRIGERRRAETPAVPSTHAQRAMHWPVCLSLGEDASIDPTVEGCSFFLLSEEPVTFSSSDEDDYWIFWGRLFGEVWLLHEAMKYDHATCKSLGEAQLSRVEQARTLILASDEPEGAWRWPDVRSVVQMIPESDPTTGQGVRLCRLDEEEIPGHSPLASASAFGVIRLSGAALEFEVGELAEVLVHEATHVVYHRRLAREADATSSDVALALMRCGDLRQMEAQATEALARLNGSLWGGENLLATNRGEASFWQITKRAREGNILHLAAFAALVRNEFLPYETSCPFVSDEDDWSEEELRDEQRLSDLGCGPFPHRSEPSIGGVRWVSPTDPEPEFLSDVIELVELPTEEICFLQSLYLEPDYNYQCAFVWPEDTDAFNSELLGI